MTTPSSSVEALTAVRDDLAYHQMRVLLLVASVAGAAGHQRKLDGLTKLAKLDFLVRYPAVAPRVLADLDPSDPQLHLSQSSDHDPTEVEAPMIRYKYGPWDDRYYPVIGALVGRGLLNYVAGRRGSVALAPTAAGKRLASQVAQTEPWAEISDRCHAIAQASAGLSGNALKDLIYQHLPELMDRPHRQVIR
ncbi:hypothetical protein [Actinophytocola sediminis]